MISFLHSRFRGAKPAALSIPFVTLLILVCTLAGCTDHRKADLIEGLYARMDTVRAIMVTHNTTKALQDAYSISNTMEQENIQDPNLRIIVYTAIAGMNSMLGDTVTALRFVNKTDEYYTDKTSYKYVLSLYKATMYPALHEWEKARAYNDSMKAYGTLMGFSNPGQYEYNNLHISQAKGNPREMLRDARIVVDSVTKRTWKSEFLANSFSYMARAYYAIGRPDSMRMATMLMEQVLDSIRDSEDVLQLEKYYGALAGHWLKLGDRARSERYVKLQKACKDSIVNMGEAVLPEGYQVKPYTRNPDYEIPKVVPWGWILGIIMSGAIAVTIVVISKTLWRRSTKRMLDGGGVLRLDADGELSLDEDRERKRLDEVTRRSESIMNRLNGILEQGKQYKDPELGINECAVLAKVNVKYLSQAVNTTTGDNFRTYLNAFRVREAVRIMKEQPDVKLEWLSREVGFKGHSNFVSAFRKQAGMSPSEYCREHLSK